MMPPLPRILLCQCSYAEVFSREAAEAVCRALSESGLAFVSVPDLCELAARRDPLLGSLVQGGPLKIVACYPRALKALFAAAGVPLSTDNAEIFNLRVQPAEKVIAALLESVKAATGIGPGVGPRDRNPSGEPQGEITIKITSPAGEAAVGQESLDPRPSTVVWPAWFPVIDLDRCTHCLQCLDFCLFGVYGVDERQHLTVRAPENCKTNCPACSRVCPEAAIIFPKHKSGPINGEAVDGAAEREKMKVDISPLLGGNIYDALRQRSRQRFSKDRDPAQALEERRRFLAQLAAQGEIPPEVLQQAGGGRGKGQ